MDRLFALPQAEEEVSNEILVYDMRMLFFVALLGGVIPTVILSSRNAFWLGIEKIWIKLMIGTGVTILAAKTVIGGLVINGWAVGDQLVLTRQEFRSIFGIAGLLLYLGYFLLLRERHDFHLQNDGDKRVLWKDALLWSIVGIGIETLLLGLGGQIF